MNNKKMLDKRDKKFIKLNKILLKLDPKEVIRMVLPKPRVLAILNIKEKKK